MSIKRNQRTACMNAQDSNWKMHFYIVFKQACHPVTINNKTLVTPDWPQIGPALLWLSETQYGLITLEMFMNICWAKWSQSCRSRTGLDLLYLGRLLLEKAVQVKTDLHNCCKPLPKVHLLFKKIVRPPYAYSIFWLCWWVKYSLVNSI